MKKYFLGGFLAGVFLVAAATVLFSKQEARPEEILYYEDELSEREGYQELNDEQKRRIETLKGDFQIGEMVILTSGFNNEWYGRIICGGISICLSMEQYTGGYETAISHKRT